MTDDLDAQWVVERPPLPPERLQFRFMGRDLIRLPEAPIEAFQIVESYPNDFMPLVRAIRLCLNPACWDAFDSLIPPRGEEEVTHPSDGYLTVPRCLQLWRYLLREGGSRPTQPSSDSSDGRSRTGTTSTGGASTPTAAPSPDSARAALPISPTPTASPSESTQP